MFRVVYEFPPAHRLQAKVMVGKAPSKLGMHLPFGHGVYMHKKVSHAALATVRGGGQIQGPRQASLADATVSPTPPDLAMQPASPPAHNSRVREVKRPIFLLLASVFLVSGQGIDVQTSFFGWPADIGGREEISFQLESL